MNMMLPTAQAAPTMPFPMPTPEQLEQDRLIADACTWEEISGILRSDERRGYTVDIETDATAFNDEQAEKQQRVEFVQAITQDMMVWLPAIQANPSLAAFAKELTLFAAGAFKAGRTLEESLSDAFDQIKNAPPQPPTPDPAMERVKAEAALKSQEIQLRQAESQADRQIKGQEAQRQAQESAAQFELAKQKMQYELQAKQLELQLKREELAMRQQEIAVKQQMDAEKAEHERCCREQDLALGREDAAAKRQDMEERRRVDSEDKAMRREVESGVIKDRSSKAFDAMSQKSIDSAGTKLQDGIFQRIDGLSQRFAQSLSEISSSQQQIASVLVDIRGEQDEMSDAMTAIVGHMAAPRQVVRDPRTNRAIGVKRNLPQGKTLQELMALLASDHSISRDADGRVELLS